MTLLVHNFIDQLELRSQYTYNFYNTYISVYHIYIVSYVAGKPGSWISLCNHLNITPANLLHVDAKSRLLDILKEYEKSSEHDISVRELYDIFTEVGNKNSACRLLKVAQLHAIPDDKSHFRSRHKTLHKAKASSEDVCDSDLDSSSSEDSVVV